MKGFVVSWTWQHLCPMLLLLAAAVLLLTIPSPPLLPMANAFYVPGVHPLILQESDQLPLKVNALTSTHTQIPRDYYSLPFCQPEDGPRMASENLGEFLTGNKIQNSPYVIQMKKDMYCQKLCQVTLGKLEVSKLRWYIQHDYHHNWILDNLPSAAMGLGAGGEVTKRYAGGFPIGFMEPTTQMPYIYNHVNIHIDYRHKKGENGYRVVSFAVEPLSVKHAFQDAGYQWDGMSSGGWNKVLQTCPAENNTHLQRQNIANSQEVEPGETIIYTYDVLWHESPVEWSFRWDVYLSEDHLVPAQVHWNSIINSIIVVLFLSSILVRNLRRDIAAYDALAALAEESDKAVEETGWKLLRADVFRPPQNYPMLYCVFVGSGSQLAVTVLCTLVMAAVGFLSPARRGSLVNALLTLYALSGGVAGYMSSRLYKAFGGRQWQMCTIVTAVLFPVIAFGTFLFFNIFLWFLQSSASAPFLYVIIVATMWCCVSVPLVFWGAHLGYKAETMEFPTVTSTIARAIPPPPRWLDPRIGMALAGLAPFGAAVVELYFIMVSLWMNHYYYVFGVTLIVYLILMVTCAEVTVLLVYYQLRAENHQWWWFAFFCSGSFAFYTFVYSVLWFHILEASGMAMTYLLYFGYMFLISLAVFLLFGTVGALTTLWFVRKIFSAIKVD